MLTAQQRQELNAVLVAMRALVVALETWNPAQGAAPLLTAATHVVDLMEDALVDFIGGSPQDGPGSPIDGPGSPIDGPGSPTDPLPPSGTGWTDLVVGTPFDEGGAYWTDDCINAVTNKIFIPGFYGKSSYFNLATRAFEPILNSKWGNVENYPLVHEAANRRYWCGGQAPSNNTFAGVGSGCFADTDPGVAGAFTRVGYMEADGQIGISQGSLIYVGGWSTGANSVNVVRLSDSHITTVQCQGDLPPAMWGGLGGIPWQKNASVDSRTGKVYLVAPTVNFGNIPALYRLDDVLAVIAGTKSVATWVRVLITGTLPPPATTIYALDESVDTIVGWCGRDAVQADSYVAPMTNATIRKTFLIPIATAVCSELVSAVLPPAEVASYTNIKYDPTGKRTVILAHGVQGTGVRVFGLKLG